MADQVISRRVWNKFVRKSVKQVRVIPVAIVCTLLFASAPELRSAAFLASLRGSVRDRAGAPVPEASVKALNVETGQGHAVSSNGEGRFEFPQLTAGTYLLQASRDGFVSQKQEGVELVAGQLVTLALVLEQSTGAQEQASQETGDAAAALSSTTNRIDESQLLGLPLNGRSYSQLATLQAGVSDSSAASGSRGVGGGGLTVAGGRSTSNTFLLDGTNIMDSRNQVPRSAAGVQLGSDAVLEVQVFSTTYDAEYGGGSGGILNSITQSGAPEFHGTFFEYLRNSKLDAKNFFDRADEPIPPFKRNQFGFTLTGPVVKERTFVMGSFEGLRDRLTETNVDFFPDEQARQGLITNEDGEVIQTVPLHPRIPEYLELYPLPNAGREGGGIGRNVASQFLPTNEFFFTVRLDHALTERDSFFARYTFDDATSQDAQSTFLFNTLSNSRQQYLTLVGSHIFNPALLTSFRLGFTRPVSARETISFLEIPQRLFFVPSAAQFGTLRIPGLSEFGPNRAIPDANIMSTFQFADDVIVQRGSHALKMGLKVHRYRWDLFSSSRLGGQWSFNSLEDFLQGGASGTNLEVTLPGSNNRKALRQTLVGLYFQDAFTVRPRLQLNLGLRYEFSTLLRERDGKTVFLPDPLRDSAVQVGPLLESNPSLGNISPRVGLSWSPGSSGKTVIRAGFGIYYDHFLEYLAQQLKNTAPFFNIAVITNFDVSSTFPDAVAVADAAAAEGGLPIQAQVVNYRDTTSPVVLRYNFDLEQQLPGGWRAGASYVGARGNHLFRTYEANLFPVPEVREDGTLFFPPDTGPVNPAFQGGIQILASDAQSFYNSLRLSANKSLSQGISLQASYTYSKSVDDASAPFSDSGSDQYGLLRTLDRSLSNFNIRHLLVLNYFYTLPLGSGQQWWNSGVLSHIFGGWRLGGILSFRTGIPFIPRTQVRTPGFLFAANRPDLL
ncbi:MAG: TonB-dependent receptor, partial [Acidobacteria bacterium]|nr:TonB-dependent receptor [Acidobacteriota bacterium]